MSKIQGYNFISKDFKVLLSKSLDELAKILEHRHIVDMSYQCPVGVIQDFTTGSMGLVARKPVSGISDKARLEPVSSAIETS